MTFIELADDLPDPLSGAAGASAGWTDDFEMRDGMAILLAMLRDERDEASESAVTVAVEAADVRRETAVGVSLVLESGRRGSAELTLEIDEVESESPPPLACVLAADGRGAGRGDASADAASAFASSPAMSDLRRFARGSAVEPAVDPRADDVELSSGVRDGKAVLAAVLRLRGICDGSESSRRRVESVFSPGASPGSRLTNPNSDAAASFSEAKMWLEDEESALATSGVAE